jgi:hypothetical protein
MYQGAGGRAVVGQPPTRREELDLLRVLVVVGLVFFHTAVIFGTGEFPVKAASENRVATVFLGFGATWGMPLLFLIAGMGTWYSLRSRRPAAFARERLRRLGVPLLVGLLTLVPFQVWLGLRRAGDPSSGGHFYARSWDVRPALDFPFVITAAPDGMFETGHLWFLVCLLGFSLVLLPGFAWLRRPAARRLLEPRQLRAVPGLRLPGRRRPQDRRGIPAPVAARPSTRTAAVPGRRRRIWRGGRWWRALHRHGSPWHGVPAAEGRRRLAVGGRRRGPGTQQYPAPPKLASAPSTA